jgi:DNA-binding IclR family transcriptional regulator
MTASNPVRRISLIIDAVAASRDGMTLAEISNAVGLPSSTVHRTVNILMDVGYLKIDPATKTYEIGERLKRALLLALGTASLKDLARPTLVELGEHFTETTYVVQLTGSGLQLIDFYLPTQGPRTLVHPGFDFPIHATAAGKAIFAYQSDEVVELALSKGRERYMPNTIISKKAIRAELARVRRQGYAVNDVELDPGVYAVAAPLSLGEDAVVGVVALAGIRDRMLHRFEAGQIAASVVDAAGALSRLLLNTKSAEGADRLAASG